jgi:hypothetical protein
MAVQMCSWNLLKPPHVKSESVIITLYHLNSLAANQLPEALFRISRRAERSRTFDISEAIHTTLKTQSGRLGWVEEQREFQSIAIHIEHTRELDMWLVGWVNLHTSWKEEFLNKQNSDFILIYTNGAFILNNFTTLISQVFRKYSG